MYTTFVQIRPSLHRCQTNVLAGGWAMHVATNNLLVLNWTKAQEAMDTNYSREQS